MHAFDNGVTAALSTGQAQAQGDGAVGIRRGNTALAAGGLVFGAQHQELAVAVFYTPSSAGASSSTLVVPTQAGDQVVYLTGFGLLTAASTGTGTLNFGSYPVASSSAPQSVSLNNTGNVALTVLYATTTGPFTAAQDCGAMPASIAASSSCNINEVFTPTLRGPSSGVLTAVTSAGTNTVTLTGQGQQAALRLSTSTFDFGSVQVGSTKVSSVVTVTNTGDASANTLTLKPSAGFRLDNNCPASLAPAATCTFDVVCTVVLGDSNGSVPIRCSGPSRAHSLPPGIPARSILM